MSKTTILLLIAVLLGTPTALATFTLDTSAELNTGDTVWTTANPSTLSYTPGNGSTLMVLGISILSTTYRTGGTPTFNGKSFISLGRNVNASSEGNAELWYLILEPGDTRSSHDVSVPNAISSTLNFHVATFNSSAGNTSTLHVNASKSAVEANASQSLTSTQPTVQVVEMFTGLSTKPTLAAPGTELFSNDPAGYGAAFQYYIKTNTGAQTLGWTGASNDYAMLSAAFNETPDMNITSNGNNVTNNNSLSITVNRNTTVNFNVSTNLTINSHVDTLTGSGVSENGNSTVGTFYQANVTFTDYGTRYVEIKVFNTTGGYDSRNWTVTAVNGSLPKTIDVTLSNIPVSFGNLLSGSLNHEAVLPLNVTIQSTTNVYVNITLNGSHFLSGANSFNVDNLTYSNSSSGIKTSLTTDFPLPPYEEWVNISKLVSTNRSIFMWLAIPTGQEPGAYSSNINVCVEEFI